MFLRGDSDIREAYLIMKGKIAICAGKDLNNPGPRDNIFYARRRLNKTKELLAKRILKRKLQSGKAISLRPITLTESGEIETLNSQNPKDQSNNAKNPQSPTRRQNEPLGSLRNREGSPSSFRKKLFASRKLKSLMEERRNTTTGAINQKHNGGDRRDSILCHEQEMIKARLMVKQFKRMKTHGATTSKHKKFKNGGLQGSSKTSSQPRLVDQGVEEGSGLTIQEIAYSDNSGSSKINQDQKSEGIENEINEGGLEGLPLIKIHLEDKKNKKKGKNKSKENQGNGEDTEGTEGEEEGNGDQSPTTKKLPNSEEMSMFSKDSDVSLAEMRYQVQKFHGKVLRVFEKGNFFGELILEGDSYSKRTASGVALTNAELVVIGDKEYQKYFKAIKEVKDKRMIQILSRIIPEVKQLQKTDILPLVYSMRTMELRKGDVILREDELGKRLIIIVSGEVEISKKASNQHLEGYIKKEEDRIERAAKRQQRREAQRYGRLGAAATSSSKPSRSLSKSHTAGYKRSSPSRKRLGAGARATGIAYAKSLQKYNKKSSSAQNKGSKDEEDAMSEQNQLKQMARLERLQMVEAKEINDSLRIKLNKMSFSEKIEIATSSNFEMLGEECLISRKFPNIFTAECKTEVKIHYIERRDVKKYFPWKFRGKLLNLFMSKTCQRMGTYFSEISKITNRFDQEVKNLDYFTLSKMFDLIDDKVKSIMITGFINSRVNEGKGTNLMDLKPNNLEKISSKLSRFSRRRPLFKYEKDRIAIKTRKALRSRRKGVHDLMQMALLKNMKNGIFIEEEKLKKRKEKRMEKYGASK